MDDNLQEAQELQQALQLQAKLKSKNAAPADPQQPGVQAIGSNATPGQEPADWVDKLKNFVGEKLSDPKGGLLQDKNTQLMLSDVAKKMAYPFQWGDRLADLGVTKGQTAGVTLPTPFGHPRTYTGKDLENVIGNVAGPEILMKGVNAIGGKTYDSAFKKIDEKMVAKGKTPFSEVMRENGSPAGSMSKIDAIADDMRNTKTAERTADYQKINDKGITVDPDYPAPQAEAVLARMRRDPNLRAQADDLQAHMENYRKEGKVPVEQMSEWKSNLANSLPKSAFDPDGKVGAWGQQYKKALASDYRGNIVEGGDLAQPGLGGKIDKTNDELSTLIESQKPAAQQISRETTPNHVSSVDAILAAFKAKALALKKLADYAKLTSVRTHVGKALMEAPNASPALSTNNLLQQNNPWSQNGER